MSHELPRLSFAYDALEPHLDNRTMEIHHTKHHQTYVSKLNDAIEGDAVLSAKSVEDLISDLSAVPDGIRGAVDINATPTNNHKLIVEKGVMEVECREILQAFFAKKRIVKV